MMYLTCTLPRRLAVCPLLILTCLMPLGQQLDFAGLHFPLFRILLLVGLARIVAKGEFRDWRWNTMDKVMFWWMVVTVAFGSLSKPSTELFVNRMGDVFNAVGCYFFFRSVIVDFSDIVSGIRILAWVCLPLAVLMIVEYATGGHNPFAAFGGVPELSALRDGHPRCQGAFRHAILAGTFGATQIPLFGALWVYDRRSWRLALAGIVAGLIIVITASSSGALMALGEGIVGLVVWKWRRFMPLFRRGLVVTIIVLSFVMKAPVWYLFAKISDITGGGGWHRAYLIDQTIAHFNEWWLFGTTYTAHWGPAGEVIATDPNMMDITNQFVMEGIKGGLLKLVLFVTVIVCCFKIISRRLRDEVPDDRSGFLAWALGVSLLAHCLSFMSVPYFDQIIVIWYWLLASICCISEISAETEEELETEKPAEDWEQEDLKGGESIAST